MLMLKIQNSPKDNFVEFMLIDKNWKEIRTNENSE